MECLVMIYAGTVGDLILSVSLSLSSPYRYPNIYHLRPWVLQCLLLATAITAIINNTETGTSERGDWQ